MKQKGITLRQFFDETYKRAAADPAWDESRLEYVSGALGHDREKQVIRNHAFDVVAMTR